MQTSLFPYHLGNKVVVNSMTIGEIELSYKPRIHPSVQPKISRSTDAFQILIENWDVGKLEFVEQFKVLLLNRTSRLIGSVLIGTGGVSGVVADPKLIFAAALKANASGIVIAHNHPSGNLSPSQADIELTKKIKSAATMLEIQLLDHIIVTGDNKYFSFADEGML